MSRQPTQFTAEAVRRALADFADQIPEVTPRMQRRDEQGALLPYVSGPPPGQQEAPAAVLLLLYPGQEGMTIAFTRRTAHLRKHAGQISFPGGRVEPDDPSHLDAALRETQEELGIDTRGLELLGQLKPVYIPPSNYRVHPFVMYADYRPDFSPNADEVADLLEVPLPVLLHPDSLTTEVRELEGQRFRLPCFRYRSHSIWGATALILDQLLARLQAGLDTDRG